MKIDLHHTAKFLAKTFGHVCDHICVTGPCAKKDGVDLVCAETAYNCWKDFLKRYCGGNEDETN